MKHLQAQKWLQGEVPCPPEPLEASNVCNGFNGSNDNGSKDEGDARTISENPSLPTPDHESDARSLPTSDHESEIKVEAPSFSH